MPPFIRHFIHSLLFLVILSSCTLRYPNLNDVPEPPEPNLRKELLKQIKEQE